MQGVVGAVATARYFGSRGLRCGFSVVAVWYCILGQALHRHVHFLDPGSEWLPGLDSDCLFV